MYRKRKAYLEGMLAAEAAKLASQARFVVEIIEKKLVIGKHSIIIALSCVCTCTCNSSSTNHNLYTCSSYTALNLSTIATIENKRKAAVVKLLQSRDYPSDPIKKWKQSVSDEEEEEGEGEEEEGERDESSGEGKEKGQGEADYNYLLSMTLWSLTLEKKEELLKKRDEKVSMSSHQL